MSSDKVEPEQAQVEGKEVEANSHAPEKAPSTLNENEAEEEQAPTVEEELEEAKRFFALKKWSEAADAYAQVLESLREDHKEEDAIFAPLYHRYGHALLEHAIATSGALGGGGGSKDAFELEPNNVASTVASARVKEPVAGSSKSAEGITSKINGKAGPRFVFGGDAEDSDEEEESGNTTAKGENGEDEDDDDLGLAFSILELARIGYEEILEDGKTATLKTIEGEEWNAIMIKSQLAEVLNHLADVGLESENFEQAAADYQSSLNLLTPLLQPHSRRLANAYLRLGLALEYHPDAYLQASAEKQVKGSCMTLERRLEALKQRQRMLEMDRESGESDLARADAAASDLRTQKAELESAKRLEDEGVESKGIKDIEEEIALFEKDDVAAMDSEQVFKEEKEVTELIQDLKLKLEEYSNSAGSGSNAAAASSSPSAMATAKEKVQQAINEALLGSSTNALGAPAPLNPNAPVNDLSSMVKKKKKPEESKANGKRKETTHSDEVEANKKIKSD